MNNHPFDQALQLTSAEPNVYTGASARPYWNMVGPFGGMTAATALNAVLQHPALLALVSRHLWQLVTHVATVAACVQTLDIHARLAAWLVLSAQKAHTTELHLTHEHLAHMLGVRRVSITLAAGELRELGLLHYSRGQLRILDLPGLILASKPA